MGRFHRHDDGTVHEHDHLDDHAHVDGQGHPDGHDHPHEHGDHSGYGTGRERIEVLEAIFGENDRLAAATAPGSTRPGFGWST